MTPHPHDPEITSCRKCGAQFDLARQNYYDTLCPSCVKADDPERTFGTSLKATGRLTNAGRLDATIIDDFDSASNDEGWQHTPNDKE
jgi:hypothetical protein